MTIDVSVSEVIERPIHDVAAFALDPTNAHRWFKQIASAEWITDPPTRLGSRLRFHRTSRAGSASDDYELCEYEPEERVAMATIDAAVPMTMTYEWRPVGDRVTHMTVRLETDGGGLSRVLAPATRIVMRRSITNDLRALKRHLETR